MLTFIDLFAGIGGFRIALERGGARCAFSSEIDKYALQVYKANFHEDSAGDITKMSSRDIPGHDVLCAGFPCQPFSEFGQRKGFQDPKGNLFYEIMRVAHYHKPKVLLLENVKGITYNNGGRTFKRIQESIEEIGYVFNWQLLDATMFGLPQRRQRVFMVAVRKDLATNKFVFPVGSLTTRTLKDILEKHVDANHFLAESRWDYICQQKAKGKCAFSYYLMGPEDTAHTLLTSKYEHNLVMDHSQPTGKFHNVKAYTAKAARIHPEHVRRLTPREYGRLQGFPDTFQMPVSNKQAYRLYGNAVAVPVVEAVFEEIKRIL